jgi:hypothetical protein
MNASLIEVNTYHYLFLGLLNIFSWHQLKDVMMVIYDIQEQAGGK